MAKPITQQEIDRMRGILALATEAFDNGGPFASVKLSVPADRFAGTAQARELFVGAGGPRAALANQRTYPAVDDDGKRTKVQVIEIAFMAGPLKEWADRWLKRVVPVIEEKAVADGA